MHVVFAAETHFVRYKAVDCSLLSTSNSSWIIHICAVHNFELKLVFKSRCIRNSSSVRALHEDALLYNRKQVKILLMKEITARTI